MNPWVLVATISTIGAIVCTMKAFDSWLAYRRLMKRLKQRHLLVGDMLGGLFDES